ncbi:MAG: hypothetical protein VZQ61_04160 [Christensenellaceae bacterium]
MKKLVTMLLCLVLVIGTACMFGCGDATFNGNYKEVSADSTEVQEFAAATENAENKVVTFGNGADLSVSVKGTAEGKKMDVSATIKATLDTTDPTAPKLTAEGSVKAKITATKDEDKANNADVDAKIYYKDKFVYVTGKIDAAMMSANTQADAKNDVKMKLPVDLDAGIQGVMKNLPIGEITENSEISGGAVVEALNGNVLEMLISAKEEAGDNLKIYIDAENKKVKAEIKIADEEEGSETNVTVYLVYDESYNLIALKIEANVKSADGDLTAELTFKGYTGKVSVPEGIEEDKDYIDMSVMMQALLRA